MAGRFDLDGKVAMVTGGGRGIGKHLALGLAQQGADLVILGRVRASLDAVVDEARAIGRRAHAIEADLGDTASLDKAVDMALGAMGRLDILVNNAAIGLGMKRAEEVTSDEFDLLIQVNLKGTFFLTASAARAMMGRGGGSIINVSSMAGLVASPRAAVYGAAKAGIESLTRTLAVEWARHRIRVNAVAPGYVASDLTSESHASEAMTSYIHNGTPLRRMAQPEEIVGAVVYLASDASSFQTGSTIVVDGGWTAV